MLDTITAALSPSGSSIPLPVRKVAELAMWTFVQAFLASLLVGDLVGLDASAVQLAAVAGGGAALSLVKNVAARRVATLQRDAEIADIVSQVDALFAADEDDAPSYGDPSA